MFDKNKVFQQIENKLNNISNYFGRKGSAQLEVEELRRLIYDASAYVSVELPSGKRLIASSDNERKEIECFIADDKNYTYQEVVSISPDYFRNEEGKKIFENDLYVKVYSDPCSEDHTHEHLISERK